MIVEEIQMTNEEMKQALADLRDGHVAVCNQSDQPRFITAINYACNLFDCEALRKSHRKANK